MKKLGVSVFFDSIFVGIIAFLLSIVIFYSYLTKAVSLALSLTVSFLAILIAFYILSKKYSFSYLKKAEQQKMTDTLNQLCFNSNAENNDILFKAFKALDIPIVKTNRGLLLTEKSALICPIFTFDGVKKADLLKAFNKINKAQNAYILAVDFSGEITAFSQKFGGKIELISGSAVYSLFEKAEVFPQIKLYLKKPTSKIIENLKLIFTKKRAKGYFAFGLVFLAFSFLAPFKIYYITFGSLLLILSVVTFFFSKKAVKTNFY